MGDQEGEPPRASRRSFPCAPRTDTQPESTTARALRAEKTASLKWPRVRRRAAPPVSGSRSSAPPAGRMKLTALSAAKAGRRPRSRVSGRPSRHHRQVPSGATIAIREPGPSSNTIAWPSGEKRGSTGWPQSSGSVQIVCPPDPSGRTSRIPPPRSGWTASWPSRPGNVARAEEQNAAVRISARAVGTIARRRRAVTDQLTSWHTRSCA